MTTTEKITLKVDGQSKSVSGLYQSPKSPSAVITLAHGAGAGMKHEFLESLATALAQNGLATLRFQFPYMEAGGKRPDRPAVAIATVRTAFEKAKELAPGLSVFSAGKSFGGRMTTTAASKGVLEDLRGIICYGFPLHPPKQPSTDRADHLANVSVPILFLQGTRDSLADLKLMTEVSLATPNSILHVVEGADHGFEVLKKSGRTAADVLQELSKTTAAFCQQV